MEAVKDKDITLVGIKPDQAIAKFNAKQLKPPDAILIASDLSKTGVSASLTNIDLSNNDIGPRAGKSIAEAISVNASLTQVLACFQASSVPQHSQHLPGGCADQFVR